MTTTNDTIKSSDGWKALPVGSVGVKALGLGDLKVYLSDVDVAPAAAVLGDILQMGEGILYDLGTFAWVKALGRDINVVVYS